MKDYGLKVKPIQSDHYVLGAFNSLPKVVLQPDGQWHDFLPKYEPQADKYETYACTCYGTQNAIEILHKRLYGVEINADERYTYNTSLLDAPGGDPHDVAESIRKDGLTFGVLSMPETFEEFKTPRPMDSKHLSVGHRWLAERSFGHEWVNTSIPEIKEALRYSPLGISVTAWIQDSDGLYVSNRQPNNHFCVLYGYYEANGKTFWKVFDSYSHEEKILHPDHVISFAKRYHIGQVVNKTQSFWERIYSIIKSIWQRK